MTDKEIDLEFSKLIYNLNKRIDKIAIEEIGKLIDKINFRFNTEITTVDNKSLIEEYLETIGYIKCPRFYIKGFVYITFDKETMIIGHDIPGNIPRRMTTTGLTEIISVIKYYERL